MEEKKHIRKQMNQKRDAISQDERIKYSLEITKKILRTDAWEQAVNVLVYVNFKSEVITEQLIHNGLLKEKCIYTPKVSGDTMEFYRIFDLSELKPGAYGIREPKDMNENLRFYGKGEPTVCIVPGLAFDRGMNRLGYGKGYYDRFFLAHTEMTKIGAAFEKQIVACLPTDENDIKMSMIITECNQYGKGRITDERSIGIGKKSEESQI